MKTIFDRSTTDELITRVNSLQENVQARWGKMNAYQMIKHSTLWNEWVLGKNNPTYKQEFLGKIFGRMALVSNTKDDRPMSKNMPAGNAFTVKESKGDFASQKENWKQLLGEYEYFSNDRFIHDFFGKMTKGQIGIFAFKHNDHHLRQFGV